MIPLKEQPQRFFATPNFSYSKWTEACGEFGSPHGKLPESQVCVFVGAGIANVTTALNVCLAGGSAIVLEATSRAGGRLLDCEMADGTMAPMGGMRFTASMVMFIKLLGYVGDFFLDAPFPNPGEVPTCLRISDTCSLFWQNKHVCPPSGFETVFNGFKALMDNGISGPTYLPGWKTIRTWLSNDIHIEQGTSAIQLWVDHFGGLSFGESIRMIFNVDGTSPWNVPNGKSWTEHDMKCFNRLGVGSGGFGPFNDYAFVWIIATLVNGFEPDQGIIASSTSHGTVYPGPYAVIQAFQQKATEAGVQFRFNHEVTAVRKTSNGKYECNVEGKSSVFGDKLIVGTTIDVMKNNIEGICSLVGPTVWNAMTSYDSIEGTKCVGLFRKPDDFDKSTFVKNILSDGECPQIYTYPAADPENVLVLLNYTWGQDTRIFDNMTDEEIKKAAVRTVSYALEHIPERDAWLEMLMKNQVGGLVSHKWSLDRNVQNMVAITPTGGLKHMNTLSMQWNTPQAREGFYINGDFSGFGGGWVELPINQAMLVLSAICDHTEGGTVYHRDLAPCHLMRSNTVRYNNLSNGAKSPRGILQVSDFDLVHGKCSTGSRA